MEVVRADHVVFVRCLHDVSANRNRRTNRPGFCYILFRSSFTLTILAIELLLPIWVSLRCTKVSLEAASIMEGGKASR